MPVPFAKFLDILRQRLTLAFYLARMEFARRFSGTSGGAIWMFVGPLATIFTIWFALEFGLASSARFGGGFGPGLAVGLSAWLFFVDVMQNATSSISSNPHLVKKVVFPVWVLPLSATLSAFAVHLVVLCMVGAVVGFAGIDFSLNLLELLFWIVCLFVLTTASALAAATLNVRYREASVIIPNILALLFWLTPIVWPPQMLSALLKTLFLANPMALIIQGYRNSLGLSFQPITANNVVIFAAVLMLATGLAIRIYRQHRPYFADSL